MQRWRTGGDTKATPAFLEGKQRLVGNAQMEGDQGLQVFDRRNEYATVGIESR